VEVLCTAGENGETASCSGGHLSHVQALAAGQNYTLALLSNGTVKGWGNDAKGELGNLSTQSVETPVQACAVGVKTAEECEKEHKYLEGVTAIAAHQLTSEALLAEGTVDAWGADYYGELGNGKTPEEFSSVPGPVCRVGVKTAEECEKEHKYLEGVTAIAVGQEFTLDVLASGEVVGTGHDGTGQLGNGVSNNESNRTPVAMKEVSQGAAVAAGARHSLVLANTPPIVTNIQPNTGPALGGTRVTISGAHLASPDFSESATTVWFGTTPAAGVTVNSVNSITAIAPPGVAGSSLPITVTNPAGASTESESARFTWREGLSLDWGSNSSGQLGDGKSPTEQPLSSLAVPVAEPQPIAVAAGLYHSLRLLKDGLVQATGSNEYGELGTGNTTQSTVPVEVRGIKEEVTQVAALGHFSMALTRGEKVVTWGDNRCGELGIGEATEKKLTPVEVPLKEVVAVAAGYGGECPFALARLRSGKVMAWGNNLSGELGIGTETGPETCEAANQKRNCSRAPLEVCAPRSAECTEHLSGVTSIAAGGLDGVAVLKNGTVVDWGSNTQGALGDGQTPEHQASSDVPVEVCAPRSAECTEHLSGVRALAGGTYYTLALRNDGTVSAWGADANGQLGNGTASNQPTVAPVEVCAPGGKAECTEHLSGVTAISAHHSTSEAIIGNGSNSKVAAWGVNSHGEFGCGGTTECHEERPEEGKVAPFVISTLSEVTAIAVGEEFTLDLLGSGRVEGAGKDWNGQLGNGATGREPQFSTPVPMKNRIEPTALAGGGEHSLLALASGSVLAWGSNSSGQLGDGESPTEKPYSQVPVRVSEVDEASAVAGGGSFSLALLKSGEVLAWGSNSSGQLGNASTATNSPVPVFVKGLSGEVVLGEKQEVTAIAAGGAFAMALLKSGKVVTWGSNSSGQLGDGSTPELQPSSNVPVEVHCVAGEKAPCSGGRLSEVRALAGGGEFGLALLKDGTARAWGANGAGQLGNGTKTSTNDLPVEVTGLSEATSLAAGEAFAYALRGNGTVSAWGENKYGQFGNGGHGEEATTPVEIPGLSEVTAIATGYRFSLDQLANGTVKGAGENEKGQLGNGTSGGIVPTPVEVSKLHETEDFGVGGYHSLALGRSP
jgi:alpha-tubulin suppressor-like RCC1 family protein